MIEKLTKKQESLLSVYRDKWIATGLSTVMPETAEVQKIIDGVYTQLLNKPCVPVVVLDNPRDTWLAVCIHEGVFKNGDYKQKPPSLVYPFLDGCFMSGYFAFYDYCLNVFKIKIDKIVAERFAAFERTSELSLIYPFDDVCYVCRKPVEIHVNSANQLHNISGASVKYLGGFELYHLNGVVVSKKIATIHAKKITVDMVLSEKNVEVRREILRKMGVDNFVAKLGVKPVCISPDNVYALYNIVVGDGINAYYLKMLNPSTGQWHFEGIASEAFDDGVTIDNALAWRDSDAGAYIRPEQLS